MAFELRLQLQQYQLEHAEADLMTARARLILREQIAEQVIERRISELENKDNLTWNPATSREPTSQQADALLRKIEDIEALQRGMNQVQVQFDEAKAGWTAERKKYRVDQEQLIRQVEDLREKLKAATRVGFDRSPTSNTHNRNSPPVSAPAVDDAEQNKDATSDNPDAGDRARSFGIRFGKVTDLSDYKTDYRGGIHITSVIENSPAEKAGIEAGDILVGLETRETTSLADLAFVLKKITAPSGKEPIKFFVVRNGETMTGEARP